MLGSICLYGRFDVPEEFLSQFSVVSRANSLDELRKTLTAVRSRVLLVSLDRPEAVDAISAARSLHPGLGVIGVIESLDFEVLVSAQRAGCQQVTRLPLDLEDLRKALASLGVGPRSESSSSRMISLLSAIGGGGSTTIAAHLAVELAAISAQRTALVDLDLDFGGVARCFDLAAPNTVADLAKASTIDADLLRRACIQVGDLVDVFARPNTIQDAHSLPEGAMQCVLDALRAAYPLVVVDLPRSLTSVVGDAIELSEKLLLVVQCTVASVENARRIIHVLTQGGVPSSKIELVINRHRKSVYAVSPAELEQQLGQHAIGVIPNDYQAVRAALDVGTPLSQRNPVRTAIAEIAAKLAGKACEVPAVSRGWLRSLGLGSRRPQAAAAD